MSETEKNQASPNVPTSTSEASNVQELEAEYAALQQLYKEVKEKYPDVVPDYLEKNIKILGAQVGTQQGLPRNGITFVSTDQQLEDAKQRFEKMPSIQPNPAYEDFKKGFGKNLKKIPGFEDIGDLIAEGASMAKIVGALMPPIIGKAMNLVGSGVALGLQNNADNETADVSIRSALHSANPQKYPTPGSADSDAREADKLLNDWAALIAVPPKTLVSDYIASIAAFANTNLTTIPQQVESVGLLAQSSVGAGFDPSTNTGDFPKILNGVFDSTFIAPDFKDRGITNENLQGSLTNGYFPDFIRKYASRSLDAGEAKANTAAGLWSSIQYEGSQTLGLITEDAFDASKPGLKTGKEGLARIEAGIDANKELNTSRVPEDPSLVEQTEDETKRRIAAGRNIDALAKDAMDADAGATTFQQSYAPAWLAEDNKQSSLASDYVQSVLEKNRAIESKDAGLDESRQAEIKAKYNKQEAEALEAAQADQYNVQQQVNQLQIMAWVSAVAKQIKVFEAADTEAERTKMAAEKNAKILHTSESREELVGRRNALVAKITGSATTGLEREVPEGWGFLLDRVQAEKDNPEDMKKVGLLDEQIEQKDKEAAAEHAEDVANFQNSVLQDVKTRAAKAYGITQQDINNVNIQARTESNKEQARELDADSTLRQLRDKALDNQIKEAESHHDVEKVESLKATKKWWGKYDKLLDQGTPEWEAKQGADLDSAGNGASTRVPRVTGGLAGRVAGIGENIATAQAASESRNSTYDGAQLLAAVYYVASGIQDLKAIWGTTPVNVRFS